MTDDVGDALAKLGDQVTSLQADVRSLARAGTLPAADTEPVPPAAHAWLGALEAPAQRRIALPRVLLEALFLAAVAAAAAIAELEAVAIAGVMVGAWVLVALIEWAASRAAERELDVPRFALPAEAPPHADPSWYAPPVELTLLEGAERDNVTAVTRLPPLAGDPEATVEQRPPTA